MPQRTDELTARLRAATQPGARDALVRRGLARGMIWRDGRVPQGAQEFAESLTVDLLDHGYAVLAQALRLREVGGAPADVEHALRVAAESIESAVRRGEADADRDFHLVVAACAFHLSHYGARAYCLVPSPEARPNLATPERALVALMRRTLGPLRTLCARWLRDGAHQDAAVAARLELEGADALEDAERIAITANFVRALATLVGAFERGDADLAGRAAARFAEGAGAAAACRHVPLWWINTLARHLSDDLWANSLHARIPHDVDGPAGSQWASLRRRYIDVLRGRGTAELDLWPSQWEAARRCVDPTDDLVVALPTSAGKTRVAELCILRTLADERRVVYVTPLRALSAQLERTLGRTFRPLGHSVTALYGASGVAAADVSTLRDADVVVATPEKLDFAMRVDPAVLDDVGLVVLDEGHMIGLGTREIRYEVLVQRLLRRPDAEARRIVCLSAVFSPGEDAEGAADSPVAGGGVSGAAAFRDFTAWIRNDAPGNPVVSTWRPTRQRTGILRWGDTSGRLEVAVDDENPYVPRFVRSEAPRWPRRSPFPKDSAEFVLAAAKAFLLDDHRVLIYCPQRRSVESLGEAFLTAERQGHFTVPGAGVGDQPAEDLARALRVGREWLGDDHVALRALAKGVALHHGALPRPFLTEIEDLLQRRVVRLVIASPTLAQGIDLSCSVLLFRSIYRFGNQVIAPEEFSNVVGRAGRAHVDLDGIAVYPIFERGRPGAQREAQFRQLVRDSAARRLESGLVLLVEQLAVLLAQALGIEPTDAAGLRAYVLDVASTWDVEAYATSPEGLPGPDLVAPTLAELDTAVFGSVEDLACAPEALADALDAALRASLWARRLGRRPVEVAQLARDVVLGRARWLWARTSEATRRGCHAAGIGYATGRFLDDRRDALVSLLQAAEGALLFGNPETAAAALVEFARNVRTVDPFAFEDADPGWEDALTAWVRGDPISVPPLTGNARSVVAFLQGDVVYRLVWAAEAVRLHAIQTGGANADLLTGIAAATLTYGLPSASGVVLAQAGLPSRAMARRLLAAFPTAFTSVDDLEPWLAEHRPSIEAPGFWPDAATEAMWQAFARRWADGRARRWDERRTEAAVRWDDPARVPARGSAVALVHDGEEDVTYVCEADLSPLGRLTTPLGAGQRGAVAGRITKDVGRVSITAFGP